MCDFHEFSASLIRFLCFTLLNRWVSGASFVVRWLDSRALRRCGQARVTYSLHCRFLVVQGWMKFSKTLGMVYTISTIFRPTLYFVIHVTRCTTCCTYMRTLPVADLESRYPPWLSWSAGGYYRIPFTGDPGARHEIKSSRTWCGGFEGRGNWWHLTELVVLDQQNLFWIFDRWLLIECKAFQHHTLFGRQQLDKIENPVCWEWLWNAWLFWLQLALMNLFLWKAALMPKGIPLHRLRSIHKVMLLLIINHEFDTQFRPSRIEGICK